MTYIITEPCVGVKDVCPVVVQELAGQDPV